MKKKSDSITFGLISMILGILSVFLFATCVNYVLIILSVVFGIVQIVSCRQKGMAITGFVTSGISLILSVLLWCFVFQAVLAMGRGGGYYYEEQENDYHGLNDYAPYGGASVEPEEL